MADSDSQIDKPQRERPNRIEVPDGKHGKSIDSERASSKATRLALASVLGPFGTFAEIHSTHPGALMHYSRLEFHFKV